MKRLQRLYLREFWALLLIVSLLLSILFSVISLVDRMDELLPFGLTVQNMMLITILKIPEFTKYLLPMAALLCTIFVVSLASRRNEIVAIKASGEDLKRFFLPFIGSALLLVAVDFAVGEFLSPISLRKLTDTAYSIREEKADSHQAGSVWFRGRGGEIVRAELFIPEKREIHGMTVFYLKDGRLEKRLAAGKGVWSEKGWRLEGVREFDLLNNGVSYIKGMTIKGLGKPDIFEREKRRREEMSIMELARYERRLKERGFSNIKMRVDIESRLAYPVAILFMVMIGIVLSLRSRKGKGIAAAGAGIFISVIYWIAYTVALSMGYAGIFSPTLAAWLVPLAFTAAGLYHYIRMEV